MSDISPIWNSGQVEIATSGTYSEEVDLRNYGIVAVMYEVAGAGTLGGSRLRAQARINGADTWRAIDADYFAQDVDTELEWIPLVGDASIGICAFPQVRFYFDDGSGNAQAQSADVTITWTAKNV